MLSYQKRSREKRTEMRREFAPPKNLTPPLCGVFLMRNVDKRLNGFDKLRCEDWL